MAQSKFSGPVNSEAGFTYDGTGVTVVQVASSATLSNNGATPIARTFASGLTTLVGGWASLESDPSGVASPALTLAVVKSGTDLVVTGYSDNGGAATAAATVTVFAVGTP